MDEYMQGFLNALSEDRAYDYIANHYAEFTKEELKDIILECLYPLVRTAPNLVMVNRERARLGIKEELMEKWDYEEVDNEPTGNMPCDNSGFCAGANCSQFYQCNGK